MKRFNRDERASIAHALMHLETNKIADDDYQGHSGWYCGNREQFVKRHKKAVALMRSLLTPNVSREVRHSVSAEPILHKQAQAHIALLESHRMWDGHANDVTIKLLKRLVAALPNAPVVGRERSERTHQQEVGVV